MNTLFRKPLDFNDEVVEIYCYFLLKISVSLLVNKEKPIDKDLRLVHSAYLDILVRS